MTDEKHDTEEARKVTEKNEMDELESQIRRMMEDTDIPLESVAYIIVGKETR
jgi:hypothetical protein